MKKIISILLVLISILIAVIFVYDPMDIVNETNFKNTRNATKIRFLVLNENSQWNEKLITKKDDVEQIVNFLVTGTYKRKLFVELQNPEVKIEINGHKYMCERNLISVDGVIYDTKDDENSNKLEYIYSQMKY